MTADSHHPSGILQRVLFRTFAVRPGELTIFFLMSLYIYITISSYLIIKSVGRAMFLNKVGSDQLPYVYILVAIIVGFIASIYGRFSKKVPLRRLILFTHAFILSNMVAFWLFFTLGVKTPWLFYTFYIWMSIFGVLVPSQFWLLANHVYDPREAKRLFGQLAGMAIAGGITGGYFVRLTVHVFGSQNMILANIIGQCLLAGLVLLIWRRSRLSLRAPSVPRPRSGVSPAKDSSLRILQDLLEIRHLRLLMAVIATTVVVVQLADYQFNAIASATFPDENDLTAFLGFWNSNLSVISLIIQFLLAQHLLRRFGLTVAISVLPIGLALGNLGILLIPTIYTATILKVSDGAFRYSLNKSGMELLYLPIPTGLKDRTKTFIDMFVDRAGRGLSGIILILATAVFQLEVPQISLIALGVIGIWIFLIFRIRLEYVNTFRQSLARRTLDPEQIRLQINESSSIRLLENNLQSDDPAQIALSLELLAASNHTDVTSHLPVLVTHASPRVREKVYALAARLASPVLVDQTPALLTEETEYDVYRQGLNYLRALDDPTCRSFLGEEIRQGDGRRKLWASRYVLNCSEADQFRFMITPDIVQPLLESEAHDTRLSGIHLLGLLDDVQLLNEYKQRFQTTDSPDIQRALVQALGRSSRREFLPDMFAALQRRGTKRAALDALRAFGQRIEGTLRDYLLDPREELSLRLAIPRVLETEGYPGAVTILDQALDVQVDLLRYRVLKSLNRIRKRSARPLISEERQGELLRRETACFLNFESARQVLSFDETCGESRVLENTLAERIFFSVEFVFRLLGLKYPPQDMVSAYWGIMSGERRKRSSALEFLDNILDRETRELVILLVDDLPADKRQRLSETLPAYAGEDPAALQGYILDSAAHVAKAALFHAAAATGQDGLEARAEELRYSPLRIEREAAVRYLQSRGRQLDEKELIMYTIIEKVMILQRVDFFNRCSTHELAEIAAIAEELDFEQNQTVFNEGDPNEALYVILSGSVRMEKDGEPVATLQQHQAFGVWSLFDEEPRIATAVANEQVKLLRLDREDFFELLSEQFDITQKIFQSIVGRLKTLIK
ncbi:MAG: cyclic nucleotide-binding domain-containing protein [Acidobacteria bacterium]|nr:cyclic nucleotide-binding domain-containing protein [Acidobacteriota bacterium]